MGATEEQMAYLSSIHLTHVSYILLLFSVAFVLFLFVNVLLHIYATYTWPIEQKQGAVQLPKRGGVNGNAPNGRAAHPNGSANINRAEREQLRDAAEFELDALISEDESSGSGGAGRRKEAESV